jgi:hypothetical protein
MSDTENSRRFFRKKRSKGLDFIVTAWYTISYEVVQRLKTPDAKQLHVFTYG